MKNKTIVANLMIQLALSWTFQGVFVIEQTNRNIYINDYQFFVQYLTHQFIDFAYLIWLLTHQATAD